LFIESIERLSQGALNEPVPKEPLKRNATLTGLKMNEILKISKNKNLKKTDATHSTNQGSTQIETKTCPVMDCDSSGHLNGITATHYSYDTCPIYFRINCQKIEHVNPIGSMVLNPFLKYFPNKNDINL
jgi:hypothetical protein